MSAIREAIEAKIQAIAALLESEDDGANYEHARLEIGELFELLAFTTRTLAEHIPDADITQDLADMTEALENYQAEFEAEEDEEDDSEVTEG